MNRDHLLTEQRLAASSHLDQLSIADAVDLMQAQDELAVHAVASQRDHIARAVELVADALRHEGRLFYVGAGTSGRLGVLDASECPPTFRADPSMVQGIIAGGPAAVFRSQPGAEDDPAAGARAIKDHHLTAADVVCGIAAGGTTPFVHGALRYAIEQGAKTIFISCVQPVADEPPVDVVIRPLTGPEVLTGSTRLKAGTATKLILNRISTLAMVQIGKCYENLMVDLHATNNKLHDRACRIISTITGQDRPHATELLAAADGHVKLAIMMYYCGGSRQQAQSHLQAADGSLRRAIATLPRPRDIGE